MLGILLAFCGAMGWGVSTIFVRLALQHMPAWLGVLLSMLSGLIFAFSVSLLLNPSDFSSLPLAVFGWFVLLGFISFPMGRFFSFSAVHLIGVSRTAPILATAPLFAAVWAITLGGERPSFLTLLGGIVVVLGVALVMSEARSQIQKG
jgi:DME family drug/metabolite transporter